MPGVPTMQKQRYWKKLLRVTIGKYEGIGSENGRNELINKKHFGSVYEGTEAVQALWKAVRDYIDEAYDSDSLKKIYINGDGANWIKSGQKLIKGSKFVLDRFHLHKYIIGATGRLLDSIEDARSEIYKAIYKKNKAMAREVF